METRAQRLERLDAERRAFAAERARGEPEQLGLALGLEPEPEPEGEGEGEAEWPPDWPAVRHA